METRKTSLYQKHVDLGAKMVPFAGFDMPIQYQNLKEEVLTVRNSVGVFDVSHMGEFFVEGPDALKFIDFLLPNDIAKAANNKAIYSPLCREDGTVIDDLIVYKLGADQLMICVNAANIEKDYVWMAQHKEAYDCTLTNRSDDYSLLAVQGPQTEKVLKKLQLIPDKDIEYFSAFTHQDTILARTGYTGEDGFEIFCSHAQAEKIWEKLIDEGVQPCGLGARDVLRLEVCYPLYGHELNDYLTPLDSALKWTIKFDKADFIGKAALASYTPVKRLVKFTLDKGIPREGYPILDEHNNPVGVVTSGTMSVALGKGIGLAHIDSDKFQKEAKYLLKIRQRTFPIKLQTKPFYSGGHK